MRAVLVTGSRAWTDRAMIWDDLSAEVALARGGRIYVLHGDCPTGADSAAKLWLMGHGNGVRIVGFPLAAPWDHLGKSAGPKRNAALVDVLGALRRMGAVTRCIAYPTRPRGGTRDCMARAEAFSHEVLNRGTSLPETGGAK